VPIGHRLLEGRGLVYDPVGASALHLAVIYERPRSMEFSEVRIAPALLLLHYVKILISLTGY
jgi:hypothetical protein